MSEKNKVTKKTTKSSVKLNESLGKGARILTAKDLSVDEAARRVIASPAFAIYIRTLLQNWRQGTVAVKGRSDVSFSNKKPWRQKGTGRARAGSARSPLWRKGGVCHGPQPRTRTLKISKDLRKGVMNTLFWNYLDRGNIICIDQEFSGTKPQTKAASQMLKDAGLHRKKLNVFVRSDDVLAQASFANIPNVRTMFFDQANAWDLATAPHWIVLSKDINDFKQMVGSWL
jgi:large subunit ribosomal protein L4